MKRLTLLFSMALASFPVAGEEQSFILPPEQGPKVLEQCSRDAPTGVESFWTPTAAQIQELEISLEPYLKTTRLAASLLPLQRFHRQYVGYSKKGKKYIYGNFYDLPDMPPELKDKKKRDESQRPVIFCDGGKSFWGVVYSVEERSFQELEHNGEA